MTNFRLKINDKLEVIYNEKNYKCIIQDVTDGFIAITIPARDGEYLPLNKGEDISATYYSGKDLYKFECTVLGRTIDRIHVILLSIPRNLRVIQRRNYVRIATVEEIKLAKLEDIKSHKLEFVKAILLDLSGGGMRMRSKLNLKLRDNLMVSVSLKGEDLHLKAKVVRVEKQEDNSCICGLDFIDITEKERDKIIKHIFKIMREQRRKGLKEE